MEDDLDKKNESDVDIENMLQVTPVTSIKKQRKRKCEQTDLDEDNSIDIKKEFEKNGIFYYEKSKKLYNEKTNKKIFMGISSKEKHQLNEIIKSNFFTPEKLKIVVDLNNEKSNIVTSKNIIFKIKMVNSQDQ